MRIIFTPITLDKRALATPKLLNSSWHNTRRDSTDKCRQFLLYYGRRFVIRHIDQVFGRQAKRWESERTLGRLENGWFTRKKYAWLDKTVMMNYVIYTMNRTRHHRMTIAGVLREMSRQNKWNVLCIFCNNEIFSFFHIQKMACIDETTSKSYPRYHSPCGSAIRFDAFQDGYVLARLKIFPPTCFSTPNTKIWNAEDATSASEYEDLNDVPAIAQRCLRNNSRNTKWHKRADDSKKTAEKQFHIGKNVLKIVTRCRVKR